MIKTNNKKGQIAIWVILAILLLAAMVIYFTVERNVNTTSTSQAAFDPQSYIDKCTRNYVNEAIDKMLPNGGFIEPIDYKLYKENKIAYLCYTRGNYGPCINQHPILITELQDEIKNYLSSRVSQCFDDLKNEIEKRNGKKS